MQLGFHRHDVGLSLASAPAAQDRKPVELDVARSIGSSVDCIVMDELRARDTAPNDRKLRTGVGPARPARWASESPTSCRWTSWHHN